MKHIFAITVLMLGICMLNLSSCKKDTDTAPPTDENNSGNNSGGSTSYLEYKINGNTVKITDANLAYARKSGSQYAVYGVIAGGATVTLTLQQSLGTGTFAFKSPDAYGFYNAADKTPYFTHFGTGNGTITIEAYDDKHVKGSFSFTACNNADLQLKAQLSEGKFDVLFTN